MFKLSSGHQEITAAFDSEFRQREHEFNLKIDEMKAVLLSHNLKVRRVKGTCNVSVQKKKL